MQPRLVQAGVVSNTTLRTRATATLCAPSTTTAAATTHSSVTVRPPPQRSTRSLIEDDIFGYILNM